MNPVEREVNDSNKYFVRINLLQQIELIKLSKYFPNDENEDDDDGRLFLWQPRNLSGGGKENPDMNLNGRLEYE